MAGFASPRPAWFGVSKLILHRIGSALLTLLLVSAVVFTISALLPGDAAQEVLGQSATPEQIAALRHEMGLDRPALTRYLQWLGSILSGDPGMSYVANMPVRKIISTFNSPTKLKPLSVTDAKKAGFTVLKRLGKGEYERQ